MTSKICMAINFQKFLIIWISSYTLSKTIQGEEFYFLGMVKNQ